MLVYQLDAKLKGGLDFARGNPPDFAGAHAQIVEMQ